jgi:hypothetical protein
MGARSAVTECAEGQLSDLEKRILMILCRKNNKADIWNLDELAGELDETTGAAASGVESLEKRGYLRLQRPGPTPVLPESLVEKSDKCLSDLLSQLRKIAALLQKKSEVRKKVHEKVLSDIATRLDVSVELLRKTLDELEQQLGDIDRNADAISERIDETRLRQEIGDIPREEAEKSLIGYERDLQMAKKMREAFVERFRMESSMSPESKEKLLKELKEVSTQSQLELVRGQVGELTVAECEKRLKGLQEREREIRSRLSTEMRSPATHLKEIVKTISDLKQTDLVGIKYQGIEDQLKRISDLVDKTRKTT